MDEGGGLENRCGVKATVGSNPTPTATLWRGAGVVELDCLLSSYGESHRGFESHPLRSQRACSSVD